MRGRARALIDSMPEQFAPDATAVSFDEAFTLHHRTVFCTARAVLHDSALAEDVTQEVFLRLYRNLHATKNAELLRPWLLRVTLNVARNTMRGQNRSVARDTAYQKTSDNAPVNGGVEAPMTRLDDSKAVSLKSVNGGIVLIIPANANAQIKASTVHGGITNDFGLTVNDGQYVGHDLSGQIGSGGPRIRLSNVNGPIAVKRG